VVDAGEIQARALGRPFALEHPGVVLHQEGHMVTPAKAGVAIQLRQPVGRRLVLSEGHDLSARRHDKHRFVRVLAGVLGRVHGRHATASQARTPA